jgi:hypothetical protein
VWVLRPSMSQAQRLHLDSLSHQTLANRGSPHSYKSWGKIAINKLAFTSPFPS